LLLYFVSVANIKLIYYSTHIIFFAKDPLLSPVQISKQLAAGLFNKDSVNIS